ncbi:MAG TPA: hypothetical protein VFM65_09445 [Flavobacteriaceae bacterium]|nr:hypothetical protein [Flavobacteriaceae bacterium]
MKKTILLVCVAFVLGSCSNGDDNFRNPYLLDINFQFLVDMSFPPYNQLNFLSSPIYINGPNYGNGGVIIMKTGVDSYRAFDASDPNHIPSDCSIMIIGDGKVNCECEGNSYYLATGQPISEGLEYPLLEYRVVDNGNGTLTVSN